MQSEMQELIEAAEGLVPAILSDIRHGRGMVSKGQLYRLQDAIAAARASEGGWIDCKQELPPPGTDVLVFMSERSYSVQHAIFDGNFVGFSCNKMTGITHWQPLPSPPLSVETTEVSK